MKTVGRPAEYTRGLLYKEIISIINYIFGLVGSTVIIIILKVYTDYFIPIGFVFVIIGVYIILKIGKHRVKILLLLSGVLGEIAVFNKLKKGNYKYIINGYVPFGRFGDIDHIVIGRGVAIIETKNGHGEVRSIGNGKLSINGKEMHRQPLTQARKESQELSKLLNYNVLPVLCITNMTNPPCFLEGVLVTPAETLNNSIEKHVKAINSDIIEDIFTKLEQSNNKTS